MKGLASFFASSEYGSFAKSGKLDSVSAGAAKKTFQILYSPLVIDGVQKKLNETLDRVITRGGQSATGVTERIKTSEAVDIKFSGSGIVFDEGVLRFYTGTNSITPAQRMYMNSAGAVTFTNSFSGPQYTATDRFIIGSGGGFRVNSNTDGLIGYMLRSGTWKGTTENNLALATDGAYGISFYTNGSGTERMYIYYDGYIALNSVVFGTTTSGTVRTLYIGNGANYLIGGISSVRASKKNIENVSNVDWIYKLNPVTFNYRKADENKNYTEEIYDELNYGLIAEDTAPIADFLINYNDKEDGTKEMIGIEYPRLITPLLKAIQELEARVKELETK